jgi:dynein intermediate chain 2, axonemal
VDILKRICRSEHEANTERKETKSSSMRHVEGGWPKEVDFTEQSDVSRFRKKAEKDEEYKGAVKALGPIIARCMKQINTIDIYEVITLYSSF